MKYKLDWYKDTTLQIVDKNNTSKECSSCGYINKDLEISTRKWICPNCQANDRDINVAINIKNRTFKELGTNFTTWKDPL